MKEINLSKEQWLKICKLNMLWYYISVFEDENKAREYAKTHMPLFDDGRIKYFMENINKIL